MDDQFYRKSHSFRFIPIWLKRLLRNKKLFIGLLVGIIVIGMLTFSDKGLLQRYHLQKQKEEMIAMIQQARQDSIQLQMQTANLDTSLFTKEKVAREKYGMIREGETVYKIKK